MKRYQRVTKEILEEVIPTCQSFVEACRKLGKAPVGGNTTQLKRRCDKLAVDYSHMTGQAHAKGKSSSRRLTADDILVVGTPTDIRQQPTRLKRALAERGVDHKCCMCGNLGEWNGKPLTLQVDHINSVYWDNRQENLQIICPNCHTQVTAERGRLV